MGGRLPGFLHEVPLHAEALTEEEVVVFFFSPRKKVRSERRQLDGRDPAYNGFRHENSKRFETTFVVQDGFWPLEFLDWKEEALFLFKKKINKITP